MSYCLLTELRHCLRATLLAIALCICLTGCSDSEPVCDAGFFYNDDSGPRTLTFPPDDLINPESQYLIMVGDIQKYTDNGFYFPYLTASLDWVRCQQSAYGNIAAVVQLGDVTNNNLPRQWKGAARAFSHLADSTLYTWVTGNHDYNWEGESEFEIKSRSNSLINIYVRNPLLDKADKTLFIEGEYDNMIIHSPIPGHKDIDLLCLEFGTRPEAVEWAIRHVESHPGKRFILVTHEFIYAESYLIILNSFAEMQFKSIPRTTPKEIWERLVYPHDNVLCVVCGHHGFSARRVAPNAAGREVHQILFNLQHQINGGDSMLQLWEFRDDTDEIEISIFNVMRRTIVTDHTTRMRIPLPQAQPTPDQSEPSRPQ